ncbi:MAG: hypothetical protein AVO38_05405 [delta proteobacterium ML8_D]|nr:MAG: hypothetical protein AVO38_05405 [delta proteobacterium ML8_D]
MYIECPSHFLGADSPVTGIADCLIAQAKRNSRHMNKKQGFDSCDPEAEVPVAGRILKPNG